MPEDGPLEYDVVISAPWVRDGWYATLEYVSDKIQRALKGHEFGAVAKVVALKPEEDFVKDVNEQVVVTNGRRELRRCRFGDINFDEVFLTASQPVAEQNGSLREVAVAA